ncbi:DUF4350 domain-containing protein [Saccharothrix syringae]|uniref:DUF4350 domain-containing protein n=1 Tax=Saccharothrix syringae TaxID=103733 RepID=A0A5Q0H578_SACSY|nr:DUF4350 domain-containing protein [Saccharothrix syringae]QFZ21035.1 DUF4350 domain-containing protein [Saccharothrix syringae]
MTSPAQDTSTSPDAKRIWRAARVPLVIAALLGTTAIATALVTGTTEAGELDPRSYEPTGGRALVRLLEARGVRVDPVTELPDASGATVLVTHPNRLAPDRLAGLGAAHVVLVAPSRHPDFRVVGRDRPEDREPGCDLAEARAAGVATTGGLLYATDTGDRCYRDGAGAAVARVGDTTALGSGTPLTNAALDEQGNAALALGLLGRDDVLLWYTPGLEAPERTRSLTELVPAGWRYGALQLAIAVVLLALWRGRRLGPLVPEPLPVVVRATETTEGRARLYRRGRATDHAAAALREATGRRLLPLLGLPADADAAAVADRVARRTGRSPERVHDLLRGPAPTDETALVRLADELDELEEEVRRG